MMVVLMSRMLLLVYLRKFQSCRAWPVNVACCGIEHLRFGIVQRNLPRSSCVMFVMLLVLLLPHLHYHQHHPGLVFAIWRPMQQSRTEPELGNWYR